MAKFKKVVISNEEGTCTLVRSNTLIMRVWKSITNYLRSSDKLQTKWC